MKIKKTEPNFGMALRCEPSYSSIRFELSTKLGPRKFPIADDIMSGLEEKTADVFMYIDKNGRLNAEVGDKKFKENFFVGPLKVLKRAYNEARAIDAKNVN